ncbi:energy transducer TonB [Flavobacterium sp.]|uniref:energy transducer TonB n=1 Tax=Flavobacterium sp. TaxID=239 RepID=UPI003D298971
MKNIIFIILLFLPVCLFSQVEVPVEENIKEFTFVPIEEIPVFPGCENIERKESIDCFNNKMSEHIKANFKYPKKALRRNIQGRVNVVFIINKEGNVVDVQTRGADPILQTEARRIFSLLPKMKPGIQRGKPVNVRYAMPLNFKLK